MITGALLLGATETLGLLRIPRPWQPAMVCWWHRRLLRCLGLEFSCRGAPVAGALVAANHVSWLDIPVLGSVAPLCFVSKAEVRQWPLVGWMAANTGTLFMQRGAHQAAAMAGRVGQRLRAGAMVVIFPEGTTGDGRVLGRFHARLFAAAEHDGAAVQPVAIRYGRDAEPDAIAPFVGDDTLLGHLWRVLRHPGLTVTLTFLAPLKGDGEHRRALAEAAHGAIADQLAVQASEAAHCKPLGPRRAGALAGES